MALFMTKSPFTVKAALYKTGNHAGKIQSPTQKWPTGRPIGANA
jgi:hypothetical protein